jgi:hypothetical protein
MQRELSTRARDHSQKQKMHHFGTFDATKRCVSGSHKTSKKKTAEAVVFYLA